MNNKRLHKLIKIPITDTEILEELTTGMKKMFKNGNHLVVRNHNFNENKTEVILDLFKNIVVFDKTDCNKKNLDCLCKCVVSVDGYYVYCENCKYRMPENSLFPNNNEVSNVFIKLGITNNITNNITNVAPLRLEDTMLVYPLNQSLFENKLEMEKFAVILNTHNINKIIEVVPLKYKFYGGFYTETEPVISEYVVYEEFVAYYLKMMNKFNEFYLQNKEIPVMYNSNFNEHIRKNITLLFLDIQENKTKYLDAIKETLKDKERHIELYQKTNDNFIRKIKESRDKLDIIVFKDIYYKYIQWYKDNNIKEPMLMDSSLKIRIEQHVSIFLRTNRSKYRRITINGNNDNRFWGWNYVKINLE
jgi:hypothetical protein